MKTPDSFEDLIISPIDPTTTTSSEKTARIGQYWCNYFKNEVHQYGRRYYSPPQVDLYGWRLTQNELTKEQARYIRIKVINALESVNAEAITQKKILHFHEGQAFYRVEDPTSIAVITDISAERVYFTNGTTVPEGEFNHGVTFEEVTTLFHSGQWLFITQADTDILQLEELRTNLKAVKGRFQKDSTDCYPGAGFLYVADENNLYQAAPIYAQDNGLLYFAPQIKGYHWELVRSKVAKESAYFRALQLHTWGQARRGDDMLMAMSLALMTRPTKDKPKAAAPKEHIIRDSTPESEGVVVLNPHGKAVGKFYELNLTTGKAKRYKFGPNGGLLMERDISNTKDFSLNQPVLEDYSLAGHIVKSKAGNIIAAFKKEDEPIAELRGGDGKTYHEGAKFSPWQHPRVQYQIIYLTSSTVGAVRCEEAALGTYRYWDTKELQQQFDKGVYVFTPEVPPAIYPYSDQKSLYWIGIDPARKPSYPTALQVLKAYDATKPKVVASLANGIVIHKGNQKPGESSGVLKMSSVSIPCEGNTACRTHTTCGFAGECTAKANGVQGQKVAVQVTDDLMDEPSLPRGGFSGTGFCADGTTYKALSPLEYKTEQLRLEQQAHQQTKTELTTALEKLKKLEQKVAFDKSLEDLKRQWNNMVKGKPDLDKINWIEPITKADIGLGFDFKHMENSLFQAMGIPSSHLFKPESEQVNEQRIRRGLRPLGFSLASKAENHPAIVSKRGIMGVGSKFSFTGIDIAGKDRGRTYIITQIYLKEPRKDQWVVEYTVNRNHNGQKRTANRVFLDDFQIMLNQGGVYHILSKEAEPKSMQPSNPSEVERLQQVIVQLLLGPRKSVNEVIDGIWPSGTEERKYFDKLWAQKGHEYNKQIWEAFIVKPGQKYQHILRRSVYEVLELSKDEADSTPVVTYKNVRTGEAWTRPLVDFNHSRFVLVHNVGPATTLEELAKQPEYADQLKGAVRQVDQMLNPVPLTVEAYYQSLPVARLNAEKDPLAWLKAHNLANHVFPARLEFEAEKEWVAVLLRETGSGEYMTPFQTFSQARNSPVYSQHVKLVVPGRIWEKYEALRKQPFTPLQTTIVHPKTLELYGVGSTFRMEGDGLNYVIKDIKDGYIRYTTYPHETRFEGWTKNIQLLEGHLSTGRWAMLSPSPAEPAADK